MTEINPLEIKENFIKLIGKGWMLVASGDKGNFNMMTASWGEIGQLWAKPVATVYVRPERYTDSFIKRTHRFTLSFFEENMRKSLALMGKESGRTFDKMHYPELTPVELPSGQVAFSQARLILDCEVKFVDVMTQEKFLDKSILDKHYGPAHGNLHNIYIAEITHAYAKE